MFVNFLKNSEVTTNLAKIKNHFVKVLQWKKSNNNTD